MPDEIAAYYKSPAGTLKIIAGDTCITAVLFCNDETVMAPAIPLLQLAPLLQQCILELDEYFDGRRRTFDVPVKQKGTVFQQRVWEALMSIPYGSTISYHELSRRIGDVKAIRAAAATNGKNMLALIVPCHRVIGMNNNLVGYAGGLTKKKWLLQHESKIAYGVQTLF